MRAHRAGLQSIAQRPQRTAELDRLQLRPSREGTAGRGSGFDAPRMRGPVLAPKQRQAIESVNHVLGQVARELVRLAHGLAPQSVAEASPEPVGREEGEPYTPPSSGFSPGAPAGTVDPRVPPPFTLTAKRADTFPAQLPGESLAQYALRTAPQTGFNVNTLGAFLSTAGSLGAEPNAAFAELVDRAQNPTAYCSKAELDRQNGLRERDLEEANRVFTGPVPVTSLTTADKRYLMGVQQMIPQVGDLFHQLLSGQKVEIARVINDTHYNLGTASGFDVSAYRGPLRPLVEKLLAEKGLKHPNG